MTKKYILILLLAVFIITYTSYGFIKKNEEYSVDTNTFMVEKYLDNRDMDLLNYETGNSIFTTNAIAGAVKANDIVKTPDRNNKDEELSLYSSIDLNNISEAQEKIAEINANQKPKLIDQIENHIVKKGETLWSIAQEHNINIDTLIGANDINNMNKIKPGEVIKILPIKGILYKIGPGENLFSISSKFDISLQTIIVNNQISDPDLIQPNKMLILPGAEPEFGYKDRLEQLFIKPIKTRISSYFGKRWERMHEGIDFSARIGTEVRAAGAGKVVYNGWTRGYGQTIIIKHQKGLRTLYAHNSKLLVNSGEWVNRGELISKSGNTGRTTGPNLHFEVQVNGRPVDPLNYLR